MLGTFQDIAPNARGSSMPMKKLIITAENENKRVGAKGAKNGICGIYVK